MVLIGADGGLLSVEEVRRDEICQTCARRQGRRCIRRLSLLGMMDERTTWRKRGIARSGLFTCTWADPCTPENTPRCAALCCTREDEG